MAWKTKSLGFGGKPTKATGKGSKEEKLPHRSAMAQLTGGDTIQRSLGNYAKKTPSGVDADAPSILGGGVTTW